MDTPSDMQSNENESHAINHQMTDRDDEGNPTTPISNLDSSARDTMPSTVTIAEGTNTRLRAHEQTAIGDLSQNKVQFIPVNNYFKNVSENKDIAKLVALLTTCINATKKV
jgi:hypothetical protein